MDLTNCRITKSHIMALFLLLIQMDTAKNLMGPHTKMRQVKNMRSTRRLLQKYRLK